MCGPVDHHVKQISQIQTISTTLVVHIQKLDLKEKMDLNTNRCYCGVGSQ
jgi:hypothetical protein